MLIQSFQSVITSLQTTLGIRHTLFIFLLFAIVIPFVMGIVWMITKSSTLAMLATIPGLILFTIWGFIPIWLCFVIGMPVGLVLCYHLFYGFSSSGSEEKETTKKRKVYRNKILCKFIYPDGTIKEQWADDKSQYIEHDNGKYIILPSKICMANSGNKFYPITYFRIEDPLAFLTSGQTLTSKEIELDKKAREEILKIANLTKNKTKKEPSDIESSLVNLFPTIYGTAIIISMISSLDKNGDNMVNQLIQDPNKSLKDITASINMDLSKDGFIPWNQKTTGKNVLKTYLGFDSISFPRGTKILTKLNTIHDQILDIFAGTDIAQADYNGLIDVPKMKKLELDLYNQGIKVLTQVYEIEQQLQKSKVDELNTIHDDLSKKLETVDKISPMYSLLQDRLEINIKSLSIVKKSNDKVDELLCQVELYTESISEMCLELPELLSHKGKDEMDKTLQELKNRIDLAQKIRDEYVKEGL